MTILEILGLGMYNFIFKFYKKYKTRPLDTKSMY
jgi:hypothetical protein